ncbi:MAG TPA: tyrosine-protein phosphatase [Paracoccus sp. (in: a-proteobacteria)]|nr:tyrosine-protein phosphatase [Paracoccus sp. (in: a-proteobacteria)]
MKALALRGAAFALAGLLAVAGWFGGVYESDNYHAVIAGELYRSGQMDGPGLTRRIRDDGIRSVINLRGPNEGTAWYDEEIAATRAAGIAHLDFRMTARSSLSAEDARRLAAMMRDAPKPVLIHCDGGSDRTGLASALYLAAVAGQPEQAGRQLSVRYGYLGIEGVTKAWPMIESWDRLKGELPLIAAD